MSAGANTTVLGIGIGDEDPLARILSEAGYRVRHSEEAGPPSLVLVDVNAAGAEESARSASGRGIPVLALGAGAETPPEGLKWVERWTDGYVERISPAPILLGAVRKLVHDPWRGAVDRIRDGICVLDREGRVVRANRAFAALAGRRPEDLPGSCVAELFPGAPFETAVQTGHSASAAMKANGRSLEATADPVPDGHGAVMRVYDVSEKEEFAAQLAAEKARLEQVLQQLPLGVVIAQAPSGAVLFANEQVSRIWRRPLRTAAGMRDYAASHGHHPGGKPYTAEEWPLARSIRHGETVAAEEIEIERGDGTRGSIRASSAPIRDRDGRIAAAVVAFYDITESNQMEQQLRQSQKMDAVGRLAGGVAHDFNNLLTIIGGYAQMVADRLDPKDQLRRDVDTVLEATARAVQLTRQLLTFSRRQIVQPKSLDLNRLVSRMNKMLRRVIGEDIELKTALGSGLPHVKADPGQVEQVVLNLALNARDAMPKGGRLTIQTSSEAVDEKTVRAHGALAPGRYVVLAVGDTGTGIEPQVMSHLFEPFFTTKPKGKGTGLGLSTVYGIVRQAGGDVRVETVPGQGSTFCIYLPEDPDAPAPVRGASSTRGRVKGTETVLLVEDEAEVRRLAKEMLTRMGYTVVEAASAEEAVRNWENHAGAIHLLLTDVVMPHTSGRELADQLKKERPELKVLFMSGYTDEVIARHGALEKSAAFLQKPFTQDQLGKKVRAILDAR